MCSQSEDSFCRLREKLFIYPDKGNMHKRLENKFAHTTLQSQRQQKPGYTHHKVSQASHMKRTVCLSYPQNRWISLLFSQAYGHCLK